MKITATALLASLILLFTPNSQAQTVYTWNGGNFTWDNAGAWSPNGVPGSGDTALLNAGNIDLSASVVVSKVVISGGSLDGNGILTVTDSLNWSGGTLNARSFADTAAVHIPSGGVMLINGDALKSARGRDILNDGTIIWEGTGNINNSWGTNIENRSGAVFRMSATASITRSNGVLDFINDGAIIRNGNDGTTWLNYVFGSFINNGSVTVEEGELALSMSGSSFFAGGNGPFELLAGTLLYFSQSSFIFGEESVVFGQGRLSIDTGAYVEIGSANLEGLLHLNGGQLLFTSTSTPTELVDVSITGGQLGGIGEKNINGMLSWTSGALGVRSKNGVINLRGDSEITGTEVKTFASGTYNNYGSLVWKDEGSINIATGGSFINHTGAIFDIQTDADFTRSNGSLDFTNDGLLVKTAGTDISNWSLPFKPFNNDGEIRVESGQLHLNINSSGSNSIDTGSYYIAEDCALFFLSHQRTFTESVVFEGSGAFGFRGMTVLNQGMTISPGAPTGTLTISGAYTPPLSNSTLEIEIGGTNAGVDYDQLRVTDIALPAGSLKVSFTNAFTPADGDRFLIIAADSGATGSFDSVILPDGIVAHTFSSELGVEFVIGTNVAIESEDGLPNSFAFYTPYPNPAVTTATIQYELPSESLVRIAAYDLLGREVAVIENAQKAAGHHKNSLDTASLGAGTYLVRLTADQFTATRSIVVVR